MIVWGALPYFMFLKIPNKNVSTMLPTLFAYYISCPLSLTFWSLLLKIFICVKGVKLCVWLCLRLVVMQIVRNIGYSEFCANLTCV